MPGTLKAAMLQTGHGRVRVSAEKAEREELNGERPIMGLSVKDSRDGAELGNHLRRGRGEASAFCPPK